MLRMTARWISLFLVVALLFATWPLCAMAEDDELNRAAACDLVPELWADATDEPMAINDFCALMIKVIAGQDDTLIPAWEELAGDALKSTRAMRRDDAMIAVYEAACLLGKGSDTNSDWHATDLAMDGSEHFWQLSNEYPEWSNLDDTAPFCTDGDNMVAGAYHFAQGQVSPVSGNRVFDYDEMHRDLHMLDPLSRKDAVLILLRFMESLTTTPVAEAVSAEDEENRPEPNALNALEISELTTLEEVLCYTADNAGELPKDYVSAAQASTGCTIDTDTLKAAEAMPDVSPSKLPQWRGTSLALDTMLQSEGRSHFAETDIKALSLMGFNFVRVMLDYREFTDESDGFRYDENMLKKFDNLIGWCIQYGIHASIDLHVAPGYHTDEGTTLMEDATAYQRCVELWQVLATRYSGVSKNALSYNLLNEPDIWTFTEESYATLCSDLVAVVRKSDADKLIFSDGMLSGGWARACPSQPNTLLDASIGQTIHIYPFNADNQSNFISLMNWPYDEMPSISGSVSQGRNTLTLEGDFPEGTVVRAYANAILGANNGHSLVLQADNGTTYTSSPLDGFGQSSGYTCTTDEWGNQNVEFDHWADYDHNGFEVDFTLDQATDSLTLTTDSDELTVGLFELLILTPCEQVQTYLVPLCYSGYSFVYEEGAYTATYLALTGDWVDTSCTVQINGDGTFSCDKPNGITDVFDMNTLDQHLKAWKDWSLKTGAPIMCNEFEEVIGLPVSVRVKYMASVIELLEKYEIPWCIFTCNLDGPLCHESQAAYQTMPQDDSLTKVGAYYVDYPVLDTLQSFFE